MKGLSFTAPMVKAWLEGRKTVTRRLMKLQPDIIVGDQLQPNVWYAADKGDFAGDPDRQIKPRYRPGETVYIKETWAQFGLKNQSLRGKVNVIEYAADMGIERFPIGGNFTPHKEDFKWKSPRFMPEWAARSHALIVSVRPERVQEISGFEAVLEGFGKGIPEFELLHYGGYKKARKEFIETWESLHPGSWEKNEWCWRIELNKEAE